MYWLSRQTCSEYILFKTLQKSSHYQSVSTFRIYCRINKRQVIAIATNCQIVYGNGGKTLRNLNEHKNFLAKADQLVLFNMRNRVLLRNQEIYYFLGTFDRESIQDN